MITIKSETAVDGMSAKDVFDYLLNCTDSDYQKWWPGTHLRLHTVRRFPNNVGNVVYMDEYVGKQRLRMHGIVQKAVPGKEIVWQLRKWVKLPAWLSLTLEDANGSVKIVHVVTIGYSGMGSVLDPLLRRFISGDFERDMHDHVNVEFNKLRDILRSPVSQRALAMMEKQYAGSRGINAASAGPQEQEGGVPVALPAR